MIQTDIVIIGAGITGCATAHALSRYEASVCVIDRGYDIAEGATKANSGIVHAGYDAVPGTRKAYYNVRGAAMFPSLCQFLGVPYSRCGALVIAFSADEAETLNQLKNRGLQNGVSGLRIISRDELIQMEPSLNTAVFAALNVPSSAIVSPYEMAFALADDAAVNSTRFSFNESVLSVSYSDDKWRIQTSRETYLCKAFVNCAGASGADIHGMVTGEKPEMIHRRGQYYLLDRTPVLPFSRTIFQCPTKMGKGVLVSPTVHGNLLIGPNAEDIDDPLATETTSDGLNEVLRKAKLTWPDLSVRTNITNFSGIRAHLKSDDFMVGNVEGYPGAFEAIGIESPGLSSAPAVAEDLCEQICEYLSLKHKSVIHPYPCPAKPFYLMNDEERKEAVEKDPLYGRIICRCEVVTEAEIRAAIRRPVGARTLDGIKRRTRAGMGRCQGGFCSPRVTAILAEETGVSPGEITKNGGNSFLLAGRLEDFLREGDRND